MQTLKSTRHAGTGSSRREDGRVPEHGARAPVGQGVYAVAFRIGAEVYAGTPRQSHIGLYMSLRLGGRVSADMLEISTRDERNNGFVTQEGAFLNRAEALRRFGAACSQNLMPANQGR